MRLATLNIRHGGGTRITALLEFVAKLDADMLVITEFRNNVSGAQLRAGLQALRYEHQSASSVRPAENCVLLASRKTMNVLRVSAGPEGHEHRLTLAEVCNVRVLGAYFPQREAKRAVFQQILRSVPDLMSLGVVLGDLNTGKHHLDETGKTFLCADVFSALEEAGLVDAWRLRNPDAAEYSWFSAKGNGFRVDHALCTSDFNRMVRGIDYVHSCRLTKATDHSALLLHCDA